MLVLVLKDSEQNDLLHQTLEHGSLGSQGFKSKLDFYCTHNRTIQINNWLFKHRPIYNIMQ